MAEVGMLRVGVLGPGAIGGLLAALLWRKGHVVTCIGNPKASASIQKNGITISSGRYGNFVAHPAAVEILREGVDVVLVAVKAPALESALQRLDAEVCREAVVIPLMNGLGHREVLRSYDYRVVVGTIGAVEVVQNERRNIDHRSMTSPQIELALGGDISPEQLEVVAEVLRQAGLEVVLKGSENEAIWSKLCRLAAIAAMTSYAEAPLGQVRDEANLSSMLNEVVAEIAAVAAAEGAIFPATETMTRIEALPATLTTSLQRDLGAGRPSELDAIVGQVLACGSKNGVAMPRLEEVHRELVRREASSLTGK
jgi:2-dehydropantoate 2-reductase